MYDLFVRIPDSFILLSPLETMSKKEKAKARRKNLLPMFKSIAVDNIVDFKINKIEGDGTVIVTLVSKPLPSSS